MNYIEGELSRQPVSRTKTRYHRRKESFKKVIDKLVEIRDNTPEAKQTKPKQSE